MTSKLGPLAAVLLLSWSAQTEAAGRLVRPCAPDDPAHKAAAAELEAIDIAIKALAPAADPAAAISRIERLAGTKCFEILEAPSIAAKSGLSLRTYWDDGGRSHLQSALKLGGAGDRFVWHPPSARRALTAETSPESPLAELLCRAAEPSCDSESAGWVLRAEAVFDRAAKVDQSRRPGVWSEERARRRWPEGEDCEDVARSMPAREQFRTYRECLAAEHPPRTALPIGRMRALRDGWLLVTGRRGHYDFCDEARAYDLATGSTYRIASCSDLAIKPGGSVDVRKTDQARRTVIELGHLPLPNLREAVWMMLLLDELDRRIHPWGEATGVPSWMQVVVPRDAGDRIGAVSGSFSSSTAQTEITWQIRGGARVAKRGTLTYPNDDNDEAADHAVQLLRIAEEAFVAGCPQGRPPTWIAEPQPSISANKLDTDRTSLSVAAKTVAAAWKEALARQASCPKAQNGRPVNSQTPTQVPPGLQ